VATPYKLLFTIATNLLDPPGWRLLEVYCIMGSLFNGTGESLNFFEDSCLGNAPESLIEFESTCNRPLAGGGGGGSRHLAVVAVPWRCCSY